MIMLFIPILKVKTNQSYHSRNLLMTSSFRLETNQFVVPITSSLIDKIIFHAHLFNLSQLHFSPINITFFSFKNFG